MDEKDQCQITKLNRNSVDEELASQSTCGAMGVSSLVKADSDVIGAVVVRKFYLTEVLRKDSVGSLTADTAQVERNEEYKEL